jgi:hypothetical protein
MAKKDLIKRADGSYSQPGLWDNIRANAGSGKKPTKEMLAQEKKINKMANGGSLSSFKASNIQTYAQGGATGGPDLPMFVKRGIRNGSFIIDPVYADTRSGAGQAQYAAGFTTAPHNPRKGGWSVGATIGQEYEKNQNPELVDIYNFMFGNTDYQTNPLLKATGKAFLPNPNYKGPAVNINAEYKGKYGLEGQRFYPLAQLWIWWRPISFW